MIDSTVARHRQPPSRRPKPRRQALAPKPPHQARQTAAPCGPMAMTGTSRRIEAGGAIWRRSPVWLALMDTAKGRRSHFRWHVTPIRLALMALALSGLPFAPAQALSCLPHDVARTYEQAATSEETYIVVHGTLTFDESRLPETDWQHKQKTPPNTLIPARLEGKALTREGFNAPFDRSVTFNVQCLGPWCASAKTGTAYLAFLRKTDGPPETGGTSGPGYQLDINACGGMGFAAPTKQALETVVQCFQGGPCKPHAPRP